jgi:hypothetical protein
MITLFLLCAIIGLITTGITGYVFIGVLAAVFFFICGLPVAFIIGCVHDEVEYAQDRADFRQLETDLLNEELAAGHELLEDERSDRLTRAIGKVKPVINDNRQVHIHN